MHILNRLNVFLTVDQRAGLRICITFNTCPRTVTTICFLFLQSFQFFLYLFGKKKEKNLTISEHCDFRKYILVILLRKHFARPIHYVSKRKHLA